MDINIQWFPGHMTKARRLVAENLSLVDIVIELADARLPLSSRNPDIAAIIGAKPHLLLLNKADIADPAVNSRWINWFARQGTMAVLVSSTTGKGSERIASAVKTALSQKIERDKARGIVGRTIKAMVVGVPNVGKSTLINRLARHSAAKVSDRPGVTRGKQWISVKGMELLDTPGILWPKFDDPIVGVRLALSGAVKDDVVDVEQLCCYLLEFLNDKYPDALSGRYKLSSAAAVNGYELLQQIGRARGFIMSKGEIDLERAAHVILDELRAAKLGRISLEFPEQVMKNDC